MDWEPLENFQVSVPMISFGIPYHPDDEPQEQNQQSSRAEPSLSPWLPVGDLENIWHSGDSMTLESAEIEGFDDGSDPCVSSANCAYGEVDHFEPPECGYNNEEMESCGHDTSPGDGTLSPGSTNYLSTQGVASTDNSHIASESSTRPSQVSEAAERPTELFEEIGAQFSPGSPTNLERLPNDLGISIPHVVVSDMTSDNVDDGRKSAVSENYTDTPPTTIRFDANKVPVQNLHGSMASSGSSSQPPAASRYYPTNYEIAAHQWQSPRTVFDGTEPYVGTIAAQRLHAFYADADLISASVAAVSNIDEDVAVKKCRLPSNLSTVQIPPKTPSRSQHSQSSPGNALPHSIAQNNLQNFEYPILPFSFGGVANHAQFDRGLGQDHPPSTPITPLYASLTELSSPITPSPSSLSDTVGGMTRCPDCHDSTFKGTPQAQKNSLQRHRRDQHDGLPRLECLVPGCSASFAPGRKDNRMKHVRAMHPGFNFPLPAPSIRRKRKAGGGS